MCVRTLPSLLVALSIIAIQLLKSWWSQNRLLAADWSSGFCGLLVALKCCPSRVPVVEKDQQLPHWPWSLTGVTYPSCLQSTVLGRLLTSTRWLEVSSTPRDFTWLPIRVATNSSEVKSANPFIESVNDWRPNSRSMLCFDTWTFHCSIITPFTFSKRLTEVYCSIHWF